ncbi:MAG: carboxypeptidase regulatory-like domain-containing protein [Acidobacteria bacterium]|nr:carboxypeptidase regulatory-like domain-containing protein [Acidobacteriota bacterium]
MKKTQMRRWVWVGVAGFCLAVFLGTMQETAEAQSGHRLLGGPRGAVRSAVGEPLEGIMVQLISQETAIRTTVYSNKAGQYEFPKLADGSYTLRIARPMEHKPYQRNSLSINGATTIEDIVLERVSDTEFLPPTPEIAAQLTGVDWLLNLPGTGQEKRIFGHGCGSTCHSYQQVFRNRYDEKSWRLIVNRMMHYSGSPLINPRGGPVGRISLEDEERLVQWLGRVRGPDSKDAPFHVLPGPRGLATRVIITEYELPRVLLAPHDVHGDSKGGIWYTAHRSPYIGRLDPETGKVEEYRVPAFQDALPGTHRVWVDENDIVWVSENWAHNLTRFDPETKQFRQFHFDEAGLLNSPGFSNFAMDREGFVWETLNSFVVKISKRTGEIVKRWPIPKVRSTYDNMVTPDGHYWVGGTSGSNLLAVVDSHTDQVWELETRSLQSRPARGGFDPNGIAWFGGRGGTILRLDPKTRDVTEYAPPIPYVTFYEAMPDQRGEIWAGAQHGGRFMRFNPSTGRWIQYVLPEPYSHNRRTWIDNSTDPVTVWYVDNNGYIVRIQPLE